MELVLKKGDVVDLTNCSEKVGHVELTTAGCSEDDICALIIDSSGSIVNFAGEEIK